MSKKQPHTIRFPQELHRDVKKSADANGRSFNAEVVYALERWVDEAVTRFDEPLTVDGSEEGPKEVEREGSISELVRERIGG